MNFIFYLSSSLVILKYSLEINPDYVSHVDRNGHFDVYFQYEE